MERTMMFAFGDGRPWKTANSEDIKKYNEENIIKPKDEPNKEIKPCDFCKQKITMHAMKYSFNGESQREKKIRMNCNLCWECYSNATHIGRPIPTYD